MLAGHVPTRLGDEPSPTGPTASGRAATSRSRPRSTSIRSVSSPTSCTGSRSASHCRRAGSLWCPAWTSLPDAAAWLKTPLIDDIAAAAGIELVRSRGGAIVSRRCLPGWNLGGVLHLNVGESTARRCSCPSRGSVRIRSRRLRGRRWSRRNVSESCGRAPRRPSKPGTHVLLGLPQTLVRPRERTPQPPVRGCRLPRGLRRQARAAGPRAAPGGPRPLRDRG